MFCLGGTICRWQRIFSNVSPGITQNVVNPSRLYFWPWVEHTCLASRFSCKAFFVWILFYYKIKYMMLCGSKSVTYNKTNKQQHHNAAIAENVIFNYHYINLYLFSMKVEWITWQSNSAITPKISVFFFIFSNWYYFILTFLWFCLIYHSVSQNCCCCGYSKWSFFISI